MAGRKRQGRTVDSPAHGLELEIESLRRALGERERELEALRERVGRLESKKRRAIGPFDGRAAPRPSPPGPRCPGCRLPPLSDAARCEFCGLHFDALPQRLRPVRSTSERPRSRRAARRV